MTKRITCNCNIDTVGNGTRLQRITHFEAGEFLVRNCEVRRFRCPSCGASSSRNDPSTEPGFRISLEASERISDLAIEQGAVRAARDAGIDKASVSRLLSAKAARVLSKIERPRVSRVNLSGSGTICVSDAWTGEAMAFFRGKDDPSLLPWLSSPYPSVIVPDVELAPRSLRWDGFKVALSMDTVRRMVAPLLARARSSLEAMMKPAKGGNSGEARFRHFSRSQDRLCAALDSRSAEEGKRLTGKWISECNGVWKSVFAPVLRFFETYQDALFSHPICIEPPKTALNMVPDGPANVMMLAIDRLRNVRAPRETLRHTLPVFSFTPDAMP